MSDLNFTYSAAISINENTCKKTFLSLIVHDKLKLKNIIVFRNVGSDKHFVTFDNWNSLLRYILIHQVPFVHYFVGRDKPSAFNEQIWHHCIENGSLIALQENVNTAIVGAENNLLYSRIKDKLAEKNLSLI